MSIWTLLLFFFFSPSSGCSSPVQKLFLYLFSSRPQCRLTQKSWRMQQHQSAGEMIARKLKPFINYSKLRTVCQKSSSFAIEKSTYFMIAFPNTKNTARGRGAVLATHRQPKGTCGAGGVLVRFPIWGLQDFPPPCLLWVICCCLKIQAMWFISTVGFSLFPR